MYTIWRGVGMTPASQSRSKPYNNYKTMNGRVIIKYTIITYTIIKYTIIKYTIIKYTIIKYTIINKS